ncbi:MAG: hypothetical protein MK212_06255, partial [Saprospiraceae bacterium]|nr:hypothetical protein [Saprospiraceae bacterium]
MKFLHYTISILFTVCLSTISYAQGISINDDNSNPDGSAMLDVKSTTKGMLVPRMTSAQRASITTPATGLLVFDNTTNTFWFYNGTLWIELLAGIDSDNQNLSLSGNTLSIAGGNSVNLSGFTNTDNQDLELLGNTLSLTNDGTTVDLSPYLDNT